MTTTSYSIGKEVGGTFESAKQRVTEAFKAQGFGLMTEMDVQQALKQKIGKEIEPYTVLGFCNPHLASRAIEAEHEVGVLLPCNVLLHECGGAVRVSAQNPSLFAAITANREMEQVASEALRSIEAALAAL